MIRGNVHLLNEKGRHHILIRAFIGVDRVLL